MYCNNCWTEIHETNNGLCTHCGTQNNLDEMRAKALLEQQEDEKRTALKVWAVVTFSLLLPIPLSILIWDSTSYGTGFMVMFSLFLFTVSLTGLLLTILVRSVKKKIRRR